MLLYTEQDERKDSKICKYPKKSADVYFPSIYIGKYLHSVKIFAMIAVTTHANSLVDSSAGI